MKIFNSPGTKQGQAQLIGMLHVPINNILMRPLILQNDSKLPFIKKIDHKIWLKINEEFNRQKNKIFVPDFKSEFPGVLALSGEINNIHSLIKQLSFVSYLEERVLQEIELYKKYGILYFQVENIGGPYSARNEVPVIEQCIMEYITSIIKFNHKEIPMGIQMLSFADNIALEIAVRYNLQYIRGESFVFKGIRPDSVNQFSGTLKKAYIMRSFFCRELDKPIYKPYIFTDLKKKHTIFTDELEDLELWLDNIRFLKMEGIIITGKYTGCSIDIKNLRQARDFVEELKNSSEPVDIPIIAGSGACSDNIKEYSKYCDAIIIGSSIKKNHNWENNLDETALKKLMENY